MYFVYVLKSEEGKFYIGSTENVEKRIAQHNSKQYLAWTNRGNNWALVHKEEFTTRKEALLREKKIKSWKGGRGFKKLIGSLGS